MVRVLRSGLEMGLLYERIYEPTTKCEFIYENSGDPQIWKEGSELINNIDVSADFVNLLNSMEFYRNQFFLLFFAHRMELYKE